MLNEKNLYGLTNPQKNIWNTEQFYKGTSINNICASAVINETVDFNLLKKAINLVVKSNDSFRTKLVLNNSNPMQYIDNYKLFDIKITDLDSKDSLHSLEKSIVLRPFNILESNLFNFELFRFQDGTGGVLLNIHHLISDAWTMSITIKEIIKNYSCLKNNTITENNNFSYVDYIYSEKDYLTSSKFEKDSAYWSDLLSPLPDIASVPSLKQVSNDSNIQSDRFNYILDSAFMDSIKAFCKTNSLSLFNFFISIFSLYIARISNLDNFLIATPILNRINFKQKNTTGMYIDTVPLKINLCTSKTFIDFATQNSLNSSSMLRHQKFPYQNILEIARKNNYKIPNLYDILISYQITNAQSNESGISYETNWSSNYSTANSLNIHLFDINDTGKLNISYDYQLEKFSFDDIKNLNARIICMIKQVLLNSNINLNSIDIVSADEKFELLNNFNNTSIQYDKTIPIIKYFENQAKSHPKDIALVFEKATMTYETLNEKANSLAYALREKGITNNSIVGIMESRSFEMIIAILAVLKSGGAYIPIDPNYPSNRIEYMLSDSRASLLLSEKSLQNRIPEDVDVIYISLNNKEIYDFHEENLKNISKPDDLSYIIYTSGSTGKPKGVLLTQKNLSNFYASMLNYVEYLPDGNNYSFISITTLSFDIFVFETIISLTRGLKLFITDYYEQKITTKLERLIKENHIDCIQSTPSVMQFHLDNLSDVSSFSNLKYIILAGEQLPKRLVDKIKSIAPNCKVYNGYGPSETTIFSTMQDVTNLSKINIGHPIGNTQVYILDKTLNLLPKGVTGEIYIAGDGVGKGYLYKDNLTKERYLSNPFADNILYKTGDIGLWKDNGIIECKGRIDNQIKLRGLRVELGEIEEKILSYKNDNLLKCAVIFKNQNGKEALHAFLSYPNDIDLKDLKNYLLKYLPNYMMPNTFNLIDSLPFTPNGKIDRKTLSSYDITLNDEEKETTSPRNTTENLLLQTISKKLNNENMGIDSNIFECGADSLTIINILTDLFKYNFNLKVYDFYKYPTVRELYDNLLSGNELRKNLNIEKYDSLNEKVFTFNNSTMCKSTIQKKSILLTGATGFLGAHILIALLNNVSKINKIYCIMRFKNDIDSKTRLLNKIHFYFGDKYDTLFEKYVILVDAQIAEKNFGMSVNDYHNLVNSIDLVIHTAANVKHYGKYSDFEKINIIGTKNIIEFCKMSNSQLHYTSTMTVSGNYLLKQSSTDKVFDENSFYTGQKFDQNVYAKSKLLAEASIIENINDNFNATIYRIGDLTGRYSDGVFQENINENSIYLRLKSILEIGEISESILNNNLEFTPVDYAANAILDIVWSDNNINRIFNIYNPNMITTKNLISILGTFGYNIKILTSEEFVEHIQKLSNDSEKQSKIVGIINDFTESNDLIYNYTIKQSNSITCSYLNNLNFNWPILNEEYFEKLLNYMKHTNFIK